MNERTSLSSYRFVAAMLAQPIVGGFTLPLVAKFGGGDNAKGWQMTMALWAVVCGQGAGIVVKAIGSQDHHKMDVPSVALMDSMFMAFRAAGVHANITELDIDVLPRATQNNTADVALRAQAEAGQNPYVAGFPDSVQPALARRYGDMFAVYMKYRDIVDRVTFWGATDGDSWPNGWPVRGRTNHPLLFDREGKAKPAFAAVIATAAHGLVP